MARFEPHHRSTSLKDVVNRSGPLDFKRAARYVEEIARQLIAHHDFGGTHGDVRPGNIFLDEMGSASLGRPTGLWNESDLEAFQEELDSEEQDSIVEIADYLAPERTLNSFTVDGRADLYSLGCTFYFLLTGRPPFAGGSTSERLLRHQTALPTDITSLRPDIPLPLVRICSTMLAKKRADRFATAVDVAEAIAAWRKDAT